ncbi:MAG: hypothetical protein A4E27_00160 [Methanobacterium sp. PtaU1.Bin242]|nr:MAG: hypothetical protein A4E27_00160 [Methanobacterium sp. PtaU1.Bin242]
MKASENLKNRLEYSFEEARGLKSFKSYVNNSIIAYENEEHHYTLNDYKILLLLDNVLEKVV